MKLEAFRSALRTHPVMAILRGCGRDEAVELAQRCWMAGLQLVEVAQQRPEDGDVLQAVIEVAHGRPVGAGTILDATAARAALERGATFVVSPGLDTEVVEVTRDAGALPVPGVLTPTEIMEARRAGVQALKLFPAGPVGPSYLSAMMAPFPDLAFLAVGGVGSADIEPLMRAGAVGIGIGSELANLLSEREQQ